MTDVKTVNDCISRIHSMANATIEEKVTWVRSFTDVTLNFSNVVSLFSAVTNDS